MGSCDAESRTVLRKHASYRGIHHHDKNAALTDCRISPWLLEISLKKKYLKKFFAGEDNQKKIRRYKGKNLLRTASSDSTILMVMGF